MAMAAAAGMREQLEAADRKETGELLGGGLRWGQRGCSARGEIASAAGAAVDGVYKRDRV